MPIQIRQNEFLRNILTLMGGTSLAQVIPIALQPLLRRLFEPELFGVYSLYLSYISVIVVISTLKWDLAIVVQKDNKKAMNITAVALLISLLINTFILILGFIFYDSILGRLKFPEAYGWWILFVPLSAWLLSSYQVLNFWLVRQKAFFIISTNKIVRRSSEGIVQSGFGFIKYGPGLLIGDLVGNFANVVAGLFQGFRKGLSLREINFPTMRKVAAEESDFPKYQALPALLTTISIALPVIIVNKYFGVLETSYFDLTRMVLLVPTTLIATAVSQVIFQKLSERINTSQHIARLLLKTSAVLASIALIIVLIMLFLGPFLFGFVFDESYRVSGEYAKVLAVAFMLPFIVSPISMTLTALKKLKILAVWQIIYFAVMMGLLYGNFNDIEKFFLVFTIVNVIAYAIYWLVSIFLAMQHDKRLTEDKLK